MWGTNHFKRSQMLTRFDSLSTHIWTQSTNFYYDRLKSDFPLVYERDFPLVFESDFPVLYKRDFPLVYESYLPLVHKSVSPLVYESDRPLINGVT